MYCVMHIYDIVSQYCPRFVQIRRHVPRKPEQLARTRVRIFEERVIGVSCLLSLQLLHILEGEVSRFVRIFPIIYADENSFRCLSNY